MKIAFFELEPWENKIIKDKLKRNVFYFSEKELTDNNVNRIKNCEVLSVFIYSQINKDILDRLPKLKVIATRSTGLDHIDLEECKKRKIKIYNIPSYGEYTVAEHTFALIFALSKKIVEAAGRVKQNNFSLDGLRTFDLKDKTLGVIGCGNIGLHVIQIANALKMNVLVSSHHRDLKLSRKYNFKYSSLNQLLENSDIITIHCPLNKETFHLINRNNIKLIKKGAYLVNTARGNIIETKALMYALDKNILAGAGLDVLEGENEIREEKQLIHNKSLTKNLKETLTANHKLLKERNVIVTPHNAFNSQEAMMRILEGTISNIKMAIHSRRKN